VRVMLWTVLAFLANDSINRILTFSVPMGVFFYTIIGLLIIGSIKEWRDGNN